jgi:hypothetical protein
MTIQEARQLVDTIKWKYAKSYSKTFPHYYTKRSLLNNDQLYEDFIEHIRENSKLKTFYSKQYLYYELDGYEYWEMGRPKKAVQIINKAKINDNAKYRKYKIGSNDREILLSKLKQRDKYLETLLLKELKTAKDIIQIDFLLNSVRRIDGGGKNIIDHSKIEIRYE